MAPVVFGDPVSSFPNFLDCVMNGDANASFFDTFKIVQVITYEADLFIFDSKLFDQLIHGLQLVFDSEIGMIDVKLFCPFINIVVLIS